MSHNAVGQVANAQLERWKTADMGTQRFVLSLARRAFDAYTLHHEIIECPKNIPDLLRGRAGVFVSAMDAKGAPRCCMGTIDPMEPDIAHEIVANAIAAAGNDRRFRPIKREELNKLRLIVSIVGRPAPIAESAARQIDPTRHGLVVKNGDRYGIMLSGETDKIGLMLKWGRIRAGAKPETKVEYLLIDDVRFVESIHI